MVLEKTLESPLDCRESLLDCREIQPVHPKGDQSWMFIGRTDAEAETPVRWDPAARHATLELQGDLGGAVLSGASRVWVRLSLLPQQLTRSLSLTFFISGRGLKGMDCSHCCLIGKNQPGAAGKETGCETAAAGGRPSPGGC